MRAGFILFSAAALLLHQSPTALAQAPLPVRAVRSIQPEDADFQDLEFLTQEIGPARVVMLGEPTHGEGEVFGAKIRLLRFLRERMGFTTVAFESGFYDLYRAEQALRAGTPAVEALGKSVFPIWMNTQEFQPLLPLVGPGKLRVSGFDPQLSGDYSEELTDDLRAFLAPERGAADLNYDYLEEVISYMGERFALPPDNKLGNLLFDRELAKAGRLLARVAAGPDAGRRTTAAFWQQCLRSLQAQARDYAQHNPNDKTAATFRAADSNPRDAQMADNLLWYLRQHPEEKVVCWGALPHLAARADALHETELRAYRPMGRAVRAALGPDQVYVLGTLGGGGRHGMLGDSARAIPSPAAGSLEAELLAQPAPYAFVSLKHDAPGRELTTYAFDYKPVSGPWSEVVDGFLFIRDINPPRLVSRETLRAGLPALGETAGSQSPPPSVLAPLRRRPARGGAAAGAASAAGVAGALPVAPSVRGVVLDQKTGRPVFYASVHVPGQAGGTVADGAGRFALARPAGGSALEVSCVGYASRRVAAPPLTDAAPLTVRLVPAEYELAAVQVRGERLDPRQILKKVLAAIPANYEQGDYSTEIYARRRITNFDTLRYDAEEVAQGFVPAGYRDWAGGFLSLQPQPRLQARERHVLTDSARPLGWAALLGDGQGFIPNSADAVRITPLFKAATARKFELHLDSVLEHGDETSYAISFRAKIANHRSTGTYLTSGYLGRFVVRRKDYAVTRYEALWQTDTASMNKTARKVYGKDALLARLYHDVLTDSRTDLTLTYVQGKNGRYYLRRSVAQNISAGRNLGGNAFYNQLSAEFYYTPLPPDTLPLPEPSPAQRHEPEPPVPYRPEFWDMYQRPTTDAPAVAPAIRL